MGIVAARDFNVAYILLDSAFLLLLAGLLLWKRRYLTALWGLFGGILYFAVDYGVFHLLLHTRSITGGSLFWVLLWMSMSYGFTNFVWIWLCLDRDRHLTEWTLLLVSWWLACPMLAEMIPSSAIHIQRTTGSYHGWMGAILFLSYLGVILWNLRREDRAGRVNLLRLWAIGVGAQFGWEFSLLLGGIRSAGMPLEAQLRTLAVNSLVETNLGMPAIFGLYLLLTARWQEDLRPRGQTIRARFAENQAMRCRR